MSTWTRSLSRVDLLVLHHQGDGSRPLTLAELDELHRKRFPSHPRPGPQYHRVIHWTGKAWDVATTRSLVSIGWHAGARLRPGWRNVNSSSVGVCLLDALEHQEPNSEAYELLVRTCAELVLQLPLLTPAGIVGHGDVAETGCPGLLSAAQVRAEVEALLLQRARTERASRGISSLGAPFAMEPT